jgi:WD40 repeat protein
LHGELVCKPFKGHEDEVWSVAFSPDSQRIVSGSADHTMRLWDAMTGKLMGTLMEGHEKAVLSVAFSPDGQRIVSGSEDRTVRVWEGDWPGWMRIACARTQYHPFYANPQDQLSDPNLIKIAQDAKQACEARPWLAVGQPVSPLALRQPINR